MSAREDLVAALEAAGITATPAQLLTWFNKLYELGYTVVPASLTADMRSWAQHGAMQALQSKDAGEADVYNRAWKSTTWYTWAEIRGQLTVAAKAAADVTNAGGTITETPIEARERERRTAPRG